MKNSVKSILALAACFVGLDILGSKILNYGVAHGIDLFVTKLNRDAIKKVNDEVIPELNEKYKEYDFSKDDDACAAYNEEYKNRKNAAIADEFMKYSTPWHTVHEGDDENEEE